MFLRASQMVLVVKNLPTNAEDIRDVGSIPGLGRSPGRGHDNPLLYSSLVNPQRIRGQRSLVGYSSQRRSQACLQHACTMLLTTAKHHYNFSYSFSNNFVENFRDIVYHFQITMKITNKRKKKYLDLIPNHKK